MSTDPEERLQEIKNLIEREIVGLQYLSIQLANGTSVEVDNRDS